MTGLRNLAVSAVVVLVPLVSAQTSQAPPPESPIDAANRPVRVIVPPPRVGIMGQVELTIEDAVSDVLANNHDIESSRIDRQVASIRLTGARGSYDPRFGADGGWVRSINPVASALGGGSTPGQVRQITTTVSPNLSGLLPYTGATYSVSFANNRNTTDNVFATLNPQYPTTLSFSATQPLWRGLRYDDARRQIEIAKKNNALTDEQFRQRVIEVVTQAVAAYWELEFAYRNFQIQTEAVELARRQVESNQRQAQQGILAPIDIVEAETQLANFEQSLYTAQQNLTRAENTLKALMLLDRRSPLWSAALIPITPLNLDKPTADYAAAIEDALNTRPELAQLKISRDVNQANVRYFREQTKPQVDLVATYSAAGLAGAQVPGSGSFFGSSNTALNDRVNELSTLLGLQPLPASTPVNTGPPAVLVGSYGQSLSNLIGFNYPTANASLRISLPLRNRVAEANLAASVADTRRIDNQRDQVEMAIEADVRNTIQAMDTAKARLDASIIARQSAEQQYQSEQRKFQEGTSSSFLVLQRQTSLITTRTNELRAEADLSRAIADFERATARTLQVRNINIQGAAVPPSRTAAPVK